MQAWWATWFFGTGRYTLRSPTTGTLKYWSSAPQTSLLGHLLSYVVPGTSQRGGLSFSAMFKTHQTVITTSRLLHVLWCPRGNVEKQNRVMKATELVWICVQAGLCLVLEETGWCRCESGRRWLHKTTTERKMLRVQVCEVAALPAPCECTCKDTCAHALTHVHMPFLLHARSLSWSKGHYASLWHVLELAEISLASRGLQTRCWCLPQPFCSRMSLPCLRRAPVVDLGRASSLWGWRSTGTGCPGRLWSLLLWRYSRPAWTGSSAAYCRWPCFCSRVGLDDPQRSLPNPIIPWKKKKICENNVIILLTYYWKLLEELLMLS